MKRFPNRIIIEREKLNPDGDGAGNFAAGFEKLVGPLWADIQSEGLAASEDEAAGQEASRQRFTVDVRRTPLTDAVDVRDRITEPLKAPRGPRLFDILAVEKTDRSKYIRFRVQITPLN